ncbi:MAG: hypothetical protein KDG50_03220 [Chromatiales bacterium]|nr:hypothetical protein [Chromatiales bacterium]
MRAVSRLAAVASGAIGNPLVASATFYASPTAPLAQTSLIGALPVVRMPEDGRRYRIRNLHVGPFMSRELSARYDSSAPVPEDTHQAGTRSPIFLAVLSCGETALYDALGKDWRTTFPFESLDFNGSNYTALSDIFALRLQSGDIAGTLTNYITTTGGNVDGTTNLARMRFLKNIEAVCFCSGRAGGRTRAAFPINPAHRYLLLFLQSGPTLARRWAASDAFRLSTYTAAIIADATVAVNFNLEEVAA